MTTIIMKNTYQATIALFWGIPTDIIQSLIIQKLNTILNYAIRFILGIISTVSYIHFILLNIHYAGLKLKTLDDSICVFTTHACMKILIVFTKIYTKKYLTHNCGIASCLIICNKALSNYPCVKPFMKIMAQVKKGN